MKYSLSKSISEVKIFKSKIAEWSSQFNPLVILDNNCFKSKYSNYEFIAACGNYKVFKYNLDIFYDLNNFLTDNKDWTFGYFSYDLKNKIEKLVSKNNDFLNFPDIHFFIPEFLFVIKNNELVISSNIEINLEKIYSQIVDLDIENENFSKNKISIKNQISKNEYINNLNEIKNHIKRGDIYEMNYCQNFFNDSSEIKPFNVFKHLNKISPTPFASYLKFDDKYLICASPERFISKNGNKIISQPIKGTIRRGLNPEEDLELINFLKNNPKDIAENIMIVDLVRNDLSRTALRGSVNVKELCEIYSFNQVHQMISTIESIQNPEFSVVDIIKNAFPMGSMTGAPKIRAMQLIDEFEVFRRGIFSGAVGYFNPENDFDFNVVIRSIMYNSSNKYLSYKTGGAITYKSDANSEYDECLIKAKAINQVL